MKHPLSRLPALFFSLVLALAGLPAALAQSPPKAQQFTLANGMTLIVKPDPRAPTAVHIRVIEPRRVVMMSPWTYWREPLPMPVALVGVQTDEPLATSVEMSS